MTTMQQQNRSLSAKKMLCRNLKILTKHQSKLNQHPLLMTMILCLTSLNLLIVEDEIQSDMFDTSCDSIIH